jgi:branched-chain amino acid transport system substrate-binding protein
MKRSLAILLAMLSTATLQAENRTALLIANGAYKNFGRLANPVPEAEALESALAGLGFKTILVKDGSREAMLDALDDFEASLRSRGGIAFFHYGGHGVQVGGKNYLIPADADIPDERRVATRAVDLDELMSSLDVAGAEVNIVVIDACRNNPLPAQAGRSATRGLAVTGAKPRNSIIVYSAESGTVAQDGLFTPALTRAIATPGVSLQDAVMAVRLEVFKKSDGAQTPGAYDQLFSKVYLAGAPAAAPSMSVERAYGSIVVKAATAGVLYLDGTKLIDLSARGEIRLDNIEAGEHGLELRYAQGNKEKKSATVQRDQASSVSFTWERPAPSIESTLKGEIRIGGIAPMTGSIAYYGIPAKRGMELAVEEWNQREGLLGKRIKLIFADDKSNTDSSAAAFEKLIKQDKVSAIVGTIASPMTLAGAPIAQAEKIPVISPTSTDEQVTQVGDYIFRASFIDAYQGIIAAKFAIDHLKAGTAASIFPKGNSYSEGLTETFEGTFKALGGRILAHEAHPAGGADFKAQVEAIVRTKPDLIYCPDFDKDAGLTVRWARELGYTGPFVGGDGWDSPGLSAVGGAAVVNCYFTNHYAQDASTAAVLSFIERFKSKYGSTPDAPAALAYDAMYIMLDAIKRAGKTDGPAIRDALAKTDLSLISGRIRFDGDRNPIKSAVIVQIRDGKGVYLTTIDP